MIFSADIEDWQQSVLDFKNPITRRVLASTYKLLAILDDHQVKGTFFVQGMVTEKFPNLIKEIANCGHELASHSYSHEYIFDMSAKQFDKELETSVLPIEDLTGQKVIGFRAPKFSIREDMLDWYCETLQKYGIKYDSSVFPMQVKVQGYGFSDTNIVDVFKNKGIDEYPMTIADIRGKKIPVMGGGYFRLYPYWLTKSLSRNNIDEDSVFYMHPYELDPDERRQVSKTYTIPTRLKLTQFLGRASQEKKLHRLLSDYSCTSFKDKYYTE
jgi:polysaccharide deacetylase family protein (PEP-CTERM system associated)